MHLKQTGRSLWDELYKDKIFEACAILIWNNTKGVSILCCYRAPNGDTNCLKDQLDAKMIYLEHTKAQLIICGDINMNYFIDNNKKDQLQMLLNIFNLQKVIDFPTRVVLSAVSLIDNLFWDKRRIGNFHLLPALNGLSDHDGHISVLENFQVSTKNIVQKY